MRGMPATGRGVGGAQHQNEHEYVPSEFFSTQPQGLGYAEPDSRRDPYGADGRGGGLPWGSASRYGGVGGGGGPSGALAIPPSPFAGGADLDRQYAEAGIPRRRTPAPTPASAAATPSAGERAPPTASLGSLPPMASLMDAERSGSGVPATYASSPGLAGFSPSTSTMGTPYRAGATPAPATGGRSLAGVGIRGAAASTPSWTSPKARTPGGSPMSAMRQRGQPQDSSQLMLPSAPGDGALDGWVTVFGFPPSQLGLVLKRFQGYGEVVRHSVGSGNWLHVQYASSLQVAKALSQNGKVLAPSNSMLGVVRATEQSLAQISARDPGQLQTAPPDKAFGPSHQLHRARHYEVDDTDLLLAPRRSTNVCSRVMEYLFNW